MTVPSITVFETIQTVHKFAFTRFPRKANEISENCVDEGGGKKICGDDPA